jgi:hypothetical protein
MTGELPDRHSDLGQIPTIRMTAKWARNGRESSAERGFEGCGLVASIKPSLGSSTLQDILFAPPSQTRTSCQRSCNPSQQQRDQV